MSVTGTMNATVTETVHWRPSTLTRRLVLVAAVALGVAVLAHRPDFIAFAAPLLGALAVGTGRRSPSLLLLELEPGTASCFEGEEVRLSLVVRVRPGCDDFDLRLAVPDGLDLLEERTTPVPEGMSGEWLVRTPTWGRFALTVHIAARASAGLLAGTVAVPAIGVRVYPRPESRTGPLRSSVLSERIGAHIARRRGEGVEFAGIRPYVAGDPLRTVNWSASARRGRLHVTERLTERSADVVALIDTYAVQPGARAAGFGQQARSALDLAVHGAAQVVQGALRRGDRAGVLALGGRLRWLGADIGRRQFYRVVDAVLDTYPVPGEATTDHPGHTDLVPRGVLAAGAVVVAFTPLLDGRIVLTLNDIRLRGYAVVVIDVLREIPRDVSTPLDPLVARLWLLERGSMHRNLAILGIPVLPWHSDAALDEVLGPLGRRPIAAQRPSR